MTVAVGKYGLSITDVVKVARFGSRVELTEEALTQITSTRAHIEALAEQETPCTEFLPASVRSHAATSHTSSAPSCN